ncbi:metallophosphoesterase [Muricauda oceani]|uniref:Phosphoesterase n=1 Tax=Flagellimonas oceani TaxID=2698672 RepID=A0A6G7J5S7_9FLAO|nr:metallophosphoesterase [Allomuricauda oceani]MBW8242206.1 metallophosphoesterase [Allomuricauda oceani]QII45969.1 phosphoesterase [Allomuricauda oceani]
MKKHYFFVILAVLASACATYETKYAEPFSAYNTLVEKEVDHTFYLIGDAGKSPMGGLNPTLEKFKKVLDTAGPNSTAIFLGDNIYPAGLPDKKDSTIAYLEAKNHLDAQLSTLENYKGQKLFIPGNHDWYTEGLKGLKREEEYIEDALGDKDAFQPENGCPIEEIEVNDEILVVVIDTEWYLVNWDKHPTMNDECEIKTRSRFFEELESIIKKNRDRTVLLAMHHPMFSYGSHGGQFSFKQGIYPNGGKVPMPLLGSAINLLRKTSGATTEDLSNKMYNELKKRVLTLSQYSDKIIFASGHEHTLQYIEEYGKPQIVSGSGAKTGSTRLLNGSKFSTGKNGYAILTVYTDGSSQVEFHGTDTDGPLYRTEVLPPSTSTKTVELAADFPAFKTASVYAPEEVQKSGFHKLLWGDRYRKYYGTEVKAPTVRLDTLFGGLTVVRKGGGNQSNSLRLADKKGREYVMRGLRKSAERYLQAIAFQDQYIIGQFQDTYTQELLLDLYTGAHPYAPFTIGKLSDALGMYHTNPKLYYVPKQSVLGDFNTEFGDGLYMIEEHVSDDHDNLESFGYTKKIESTYDLMEKLREDEEYSIDQKEYVKARLFDILIGDWDRHVDQWRWAEFETENGNKVYKPIARDRDQVFSRWGDGLIMNFGSRAVPALRIFEGFHEKVRSVEGLTSSPRTFALDMALLSASTLDMWMEQAEFIQENLSGAIIDDAFLAFPEEVRDETLTDIKRIILARKANLVKTAQDYYAVLNKYSVITGTDKDDYFSIVSLPNGDVEVRGYRIKGGEYTDMFFSKIYSHDYTKEIWIYGLDDDDVFDARTATSKIKVRIVGGQNNDVYQISEDSKKLLVYDFKAKKNTLDEAYGGKIKLVNDYDTNTYEFLNIKGSNNQLLPTIGFNPDDGVRVGLANTYTFNGFRKNPFTQQHTVNAAYYFATDGFDLGYRGEFAHVFNKVNLEIRARFTSPNFTQNFFGFGNETVNNDDAEPLGLDYNRVRIQTLTFAPSLVWRGFLGSKVRLGLAYENIEIEETEDRFINEFYLENGKENHLSFFGVDGEYTYSNTDNEAFPTLGMAFGLEGGFKTNLDDSKSFGYVIPSFSVDHKVTADGRLVLATKFKGQFIIGDGYEFYQAASIGGNNGLRGFRFQRFTGKTAYYQNTDLRYSFRRTKTGILPVTPGIYGGFDYGRVWFPGEDSDKWHNSYGGGLFLNGADVLSANLGLFNSSDGLRFAFGVGFGF